MRFLALFPIIVKMWCAKCYFTPQPDLNFLDKKAPTVDTLQEFLSFHYGKHLLKHYWYLNCCFVEANY